MNIHNSTWHHDYEAIEDLEAGVLLTGAEVKSIVGGAMKLDASYVKFINNEPYLINAEIFKYQFDGNRDYNPTRSRKLLLNRKEIIRLQTKIASQPNLTIIPIACYNKGRLIKLKIALARGRKDIEKRRLEKSRDIKRQEKREAKEYIKT